MGVGHLSQVVVYFKTHIKPFRVSNLNMNEWSRTLSTASYSFRKMKAKRNRAHAHAVLTHLLTGQRY